MAAERDRLSKKKKKKRGRVSLCRPVWSAAARSRLTEASTSWAQVILPPQPLRLVLNSWAQMILLPRPPKVLGLQV
uniref:Uncharacterized protein n=1 Tax=Piliocolobus tephrosceles TaxID=591936 RepID=A0A8C9GG57_9PRIM